LLIKPLKGLSVVLLVALLAGAAFAGTTGKIAGKVTDMQTGEPLPGVNVVISGTNIGAATNIQGEFFIINVPPGKYLLKVNLVGYAPVEVTNVEVTIDLTTSLDLELQTETIDMGTITVEAERPLIEKDVTSTRMRVTPSQITNSAVSGLVARVGVNAGNVLGAFRGSRNNTGQVIYMMDGVNLSNPLGASQGQGTGSGTQGLATYIPDEAVAEAEVLTGGFGAEYPSVQSAVINVAGKEGGKSFSGKFKSKSSPEVLFGRDYYGDRTFDEDGRPLRITPVRDADGNIVSWNWADDPLLDDDRRYKLYDMRQHDWFFGGPVPLENLDIPGEMTFFTSGTYQYSRDYRAYNFWQKMQSIQGKLTYNISSSKKLTISGLTSYSNFNIFDFDRTMNLSWGKSSDLSGPIFYVNEAGDYFRPQTLAEVAAYWTRIAQHDDPGAVVTVDDISGYYVVTPSGVDSVYRYTPYTWIVSRGYTNAEADSAFFYYLNQILGLAGTDMITSFPEDEGEYPIEFADSLTAAVNQAVDSLEAEGWARSYANYDMSKSQLYNESWSNEFTVNFTNNLSPKSYYNLSYSRFHTAREGRQHDPWDDHPLSLDEMLESRFNSAVSATEFDRFFANPMHLGRRYTINNYQTIHTFKGNLNSQINSMNLAKFGFEYRNYNLVKDHTSIASGGNRYTDLFKVKPYQIGVFAQDKLESEGMILNLGLRFDYFNPKTQVPSDFSSPLLDEYDNDVDNLGNIYDLEYRLRGAVDAEIKSQLSPRIGVSYPITDKDVFHFNYGHYFQLPMFDYFYMNHGYDTRGQHKYFGNPDLKEEKTVAYEAGLEHGFNDYLKLAITGFYKDMSNLTSYQRTEFRGGIMWVRSNVDFARIKGFELNFTQRPWNNFSGVITYTYQIARGRASDAYDTFLDHYYQRKPRTEDFPLDSDQRHTARANLNYRIPENWGPALGNHLFGDWGADLFWSYGSGTPYTPSATVPPGSIQDVNGENLPSSWRVDVRIDKGFSLYKTFKSNLFVEVRNLTNRANLVDLDDNYIDRYDLYGDPGGQYNDPDVYDSPRRILCGMEVTF